MKVILVSSYIELLDRVVEGVVVWKQGDHVTFYLPHFVDLKVVMEKLEPLETGATFYEKRIDGSLLYAYNRIMVSREHAQKVKEVLWKIED